MSEGTPERFELDFCRFAQSRGEWPGERRTLPRLLGVLAVAWGARLPLGLRFGTGPRFGRGPFVGTRREGVCVGSARRFVGFIDGGGMRDDVAGLEGGAIAEGLGGGAMSVGFGGEATLGAGADALCAEFIAGKDGGGRLSSSSSSSSSPSSASVNVGIATPFWAALGVAFGVVCGDGDVLDTSGSLSVWA
jgi:hypothetical protein